jgi:hypothetical protein
MPVHMEKEAKHWWMNRFENLGNYMQINSYCEIRHGQTVPGLGLKAERHRLKQKSTSEGAFLPHQDSEKADEIFGITNTPVQSSA